MGAADHVAAAQQRGCLLRTEDGRPVAGHADPVARLLTTEGECPADVLAFRAALERAGGRSQVTMVNNRGFHSTRGSFSFFEVVTGTIKGQRLAAGDLLFGHFVGAEGSTLALEKAPTSGALMIELIAWDPAKGMYDFYELIGDGARGQWFYRGDSKDIADDTATLHRQRDAQHPRGRVAKGRPRARPKDATRRKAAAGPRAHEARDRPAASWTPRCRPICIRVGDRRSFARVDERSSMTPEVALVDVTQRLADEGRLSEQSSTPCSPSR